MCSKWVACGNRPTDSNVIVVIMVALSEIGYESDLGSDQIGKKMIWLSYTNMKT